MPPGLCSACGFANLPGEFFCQKCGVQLGPVTSVPPPPPVLAGGQPVSAAQPESGYFLLSASGEQIRLPVGKLELLIGRSDPVKGVFPDIDLDGYGGEQAGVSRLHARLLLFPGPPRIEDLNSTNYTFLNNLRLLPGRSYTLRDGDALQLGTLRLEFGSGLQPASEGQERGSPPASPAGETGEPS